MTRPLCEKCNGCGRVYAHDPSGDGHGGLNGGSWGWFQCSKCEGTGYADAKDKRRERWLKTWTLRVCYTCGVIKTEKGYTGCDTPGCGTIGHGEEVEVKRA